MLPRYTWRTVAVDEASVRSLAEALELPEPVARALVARGVGSREAAAAFLSPDLKAHLSAPFDFPGVREEVGQVHA